MRALAFVLMTALAGGSAHAGQVTTTLAIRVTVLESCRVRTSPLTLAPRLSSQASSSGTQTTGTIRVQCTKGTPASLALDPGPLTGPGGAQLRYTLSAASSVLGRGREVIDLPVTGEVAGGQAVPAGDYAGQALVRVTY